MKMLIVLLLCGAASGQSKTVQRHRLSADCDKALNADVWTISDDDLSWTLAQVIECSQSPSLTKDERLRFSQQAYFGGFAEASRASLKTIDENKAAVAAKDDRINTLQSLYWALSEEHEQTKQRLGTEEALVNALSSQPRFDFSAQDQAFQLERLNEKLSQIQINQQRQAASPVQSAPQMQTTPTPWRNQVFCNVTPNGPGPYAGDFVACQ